jgi:hypothetical protein
MWCQRKECAEILSFNFWSDFRCTKWVLVEKERFILKEKPNQEICRNVFFSKRFRQYWEVNIPECLYVTCCIRLPFLYSTSSRTHGKKIFKSIFKKGGTSMWYELCLNFDMYSFKSLKRGEEYSRESATVEIVGLDKNRVLAEFMLWFVVT